MPEFQSENRTNKNLKLRRILATALRVFVLAALLCCVPLVNHTVDPSGVFNNTRADSNELKAAHILLDGSNVSGLSSNYNERLLRREYLLEMSGAKDVIVAGSSRGALITSEMLDTTSMFNVSVAGGDIEDMIGFYGLLYERDMLPKTLVISIDPWTLNDNKTDARWQEAVGDGYRSYVGGRMGLAVPNGVGTIAPLYDANAAQPTGLFALGSQARSTLFSIPYFQSSLQYYFAGSYALYKDVSATDAASGETGIVHADGSYSYPLAYQNCDAATASERAERAVGNIIGLEDYDTLRGQKYELFRQFIQSALADGVEIKLVMFPISSHLCESMSYFNDYYNGRYDNFFAAGDMVRQLADELGVPLTGSFYPDDLGYDMSDFYDGYHLRSERVAEIVAGV